LPCDTTELEKLIFPACTRPVDMFHPNRDDDFQEIFA
jgi:hypothetical protein